MFYTIEKKGFTLIELLAVILILGIIALIAIPIVSNIIMESKRGAFETTVSNVVSAIEDTCHLQILKGEAVTATYIFTDGVVSPSLNIKGKLPTSGTVIVDDNCNVTLSITNGTFTAKKLSSNDIVTITNGTEIEILYAVYPNGTAVYFNPVTGTKCTEGESVSTPGTKTGCMKWYTFNDAGNTTSSIDLILDHNTTSVVSWNSTGSNVSGPTNIMTQLQTDTSSWVGVPVRSDTYSVSNGTAAYTINYNTYKARLITADEIASITGNTNFLSIPASQIWFYFDSNSQTKTATTIGSSKYAWLFDYTIDCTSNGCNIAANGTNGYWTSTAITGSSLNAWFVHRYGRLNNYEVNNNTVGGIRPVITILKSNI